MTAQIDRELADISFSGISPESYSTALKGLRRALAFKLYVYGLCLVIALIGLGLAVELWLDSGSAEIAMALLMVFGAPLAITVIRAGGFGYELELRRLIRNTQRKA